MGLCQNGSICLNTNNKLDHFWFIMDLVGLQKIDLFINCVKVGQPALTPILFTLNTNM